MFVCDNKMAKIKKEIWTMMKYKQKFTKRKNSEAAFTLIKIIHLRVRMPFFEDTLIIFNLGDVILVFSIAGSLKILRAYCVNTAFTA